MTLASERQKRLRRRAELCALGLCSACGEPREDEAKALCRGCRAQYAADAKRMYDDHKARGLCVKCTEPGIRLPDGETHRFCEKHLRAYRDYPSITRSNALEAVGRRIVRNALSGKLEARQKAKER